MVVGFFFSSLRWGHSSLWSSREGAPGGSPLEGKGRKAEKHYLEAVSKEV